VQKLTLRHTVEEVLGRINVLEWACIIWNLVVTVSRRCVANEDACNLVWMTLCDLGVGREERAAGGVADEDELPLRERAKQALEALLARVENLGWLGDVDRTHLQRAEREIVEEILNVRSGQLYGCCCVKVQRKFGQCL
jgi:hypothetical protein